MKLPAIADHDLQSVASMFTLSRLFDTLDRAMGLPPMQNSDGDDFMFHDVRFPLANGVTQKDVAAQENAFPGMAQENAKFWNRLEDRSNGRAKTEETEGLSFDTIMDNGLCVLGNVELKGRFLHLPTNSAARAKKGIVLIRRTLGDLVRAPVTEIRTIEQMMAERAPREHRGAAPTSRPKLPSRSSTNSWTGNIVKRLISRSAWPRSNCEDAPVWARPSP